MKAMFRLFVLLLLAGGWTLSALSLHVIRTPEQIPITLVTKDRMSFRDTWVDTTKWKLDDVGKHPLLVQRLIRAHKAEVLEHLVDPANGDVEQQLSDVIIQTKNDDASPPENGPVEEFARRWLRWPWG